MAYKRPTNEKIIAVLEKNAAMISPTAKALGVARQTIYKWMADDPELKQAAEDVAEAMLDMSESVLLGEIQKKNLTATIFYLKTKGKKRGYVERQEFVEGDVIKIKYE